MGTCAQAQVMKNHDSNAPVNFSADRIEVQDKSSRVLISGNVEVKQAGLTLTAARMTVAYKNNGGTSPAAPAKAGSLPAPAAPASGSVSTGNVTIDRIDASGNVVVVKGNETARGNVGIYDLDRRLITMLGNVELDQGSNRLTGGRLVIDLTTGRSTVDGRSAGGVSSGATGGRVSGTFTVPQRTPQ
jgi:lipopolysaccharide export system protein LptA